MPKKNRLDLILVEQGLAESRARAAAMIMAGTVMVGGKLITKAGTAVSLDAPITLKEVNPYVSRGGLKLRGALDDMDISVEKKICMDIGASTGGFTDCVLQAGAEKVYAIDVGKSQLHERLLVDERVINIENTNFRYFSSESLKEKIEFVTIDVSFISLELILNSLSKFMALAGEVLAMVKPQFELSRSEVKRGVVRDDTLRQKAIAKVRAAALRCGFEVISEAECRVKGPKGNREHFLWMRYRHED